MGDAPQALTLQQALDKGIQRFNMRDYAGAEQIARQILNGKSDSIEALNLLGLIQYRCERFDDAIATFERALLIDKQQAGVQCNLAFALQGAGDFDEAAQAFRAALAIQPNFVEAHLGFARLLASRGALDEAIASYRAVIGLRPNYADAYNQVACLLDDKGLPDEAIDAFRAATSLDPRLDTAHYNLATVFMAQDKER